MPRLTAKKTRVFYVPNDPDKGNITIRALTREELARIEANCSETSADDKGSGKLILNPYARVNGVAQACLEDWENFFDEKGNPMKYSAKNVMRASRMSIEVEEGNIVRFFEWVDSCHAEFLDAVKIETEEAEKN